MGHWDVNPNGMKYTSEKSFRCKPYSFMPIAHLTYMCQVQDSFLFALSHMCQVQVSFLFVFSHTYMSRVQDSFLFGLSHISPILTSPLNVERCQCQAIYWKQIVSGVISFQCQTHWSRLPPATLRLQNTSFTTPLTNYV